MLYSGKGKDVVAKDSNVMLFRQTFQDHHILLN
jgi:hypothetical protein